MTKKRDYDKWQTIDGIIDMGVKEIMQMCKIKYYQKYVTDIDGLLVLTVC